MLLLGETEIKNHKKEKIKGEYVILEGEEFYKISNFDGMDSFFMTIVSDSDHWMFISSKGGLSAGRKDMDHALFPYYPEDKIHDSSQNTGSCTIFHVEKDNKKYLWEPFSQNASVYSICRNIYKNKYGNKLIFEEVNDNFGITFCYAWMNSERFGFVKKSTLINHSEHDINIEILDGIQNIMPHSISHLLQLEMSNLVDAYKKNELFGKSGIALFTMSSIPTDKAEPNEALNCTTVWSAGLKNPLYLLSSRQLNRFRHAIPIKEEPETKGIKGAYFVNSSLKLEKKSHLQWIIVADVDQDACQLTQLHSILSGKKNVLNEVMEDVAKGTENLEKLVAAADGLQFTADRLAAHHHFTNVMFNIMRGGVFDDGYAINTDDFISFIKKSNASVFKKYQHFFSTLEKCINYNDLLHNVENINDTDLERLCYEYLPLIFSRRHGDPSRPWNKFSIELKNENGLKNLNYQGNWRDIFQNWEALCISYPGFIESILCKFLNASTADGYNPYRITKEGISWEKLDPKNPWSNIGYWGDHQIIYMLKLLELSEQYHPTAIQQLLTKEIFCYANVPYCIKPYEDLLKNPHETISYDNHRETEIEKLVKTIGSDGKLLMKEKNILYVNLSEKILVSLLAKLTNFIPEGGIWLNTQRPEWNDANNALVGHGISMVTLYYMRRYVNFYSCLLKKINTDKIELSEEVLQWFNDINQSLNKHKVFLKGNMTDHQRRQALDDFGISGTHYRNRIYTHGLSGKKEQVNTKELVAFLKLTLQYIDHSISANKRNDGLYHAYNLMDMTDDGGIHINHLYEMLEGQVALLSSGYLAPKEAIHILSGLKKSEMYREDQHSYMLYPNRKLKNFAQKNTISFLSNGGSSILINQRLKESDFRLVEKDIEGKYHFNSSLRNSKVLKEMLDNMKNDYPDLVEKEYSSITGLYEQVFQHKTFTGRSGTFYGYEGLGCIYWHMVAKLLLSIQENFYQAAAAKAPAEALKQLAEIYYDVRAGIGFNKSPEIYGAFPTDPYSHTPEHSGAKQPGLTGQVKEEVITRFGELGITIVAGQICFNPILLRKKEFIKSKNVFQYFNVNQQEQTIALPVNSLAFTFCQVPVIYFLSNENSIRIIFSDQKVKTISGNLLDADLSRMVFERTDSISRIEVKVAQSLLCLEAV